MRTGLCRVVAIGLPGLLLRLPDAYPLEIPCCGGTIDVQGRVEFRHDQRLDDGSPHTDPAARAHVALDKSLGARLRLHGALTAAAGGSARNAEGAGVYNFDETLQDVSPSLGADEAYVEVSLPSVDSRLGIQKFAWGKLDGIQPNDLLNPEEYYDPILGDEDEKKIGVPALSVTGYPPPIGSDLVPSDLRLTAVWAPIVVPFRFPDKDERWYPPLARVRRTIRTMGFVVENDFDFRNGDVPDRGLGNGAGAVRLAGFFHGADFALYYYDGFDPGPAFDVTARGFVRLNPMNPQGFDVRSEIEIFPVYDRIHAAGADLAYSVLGATLRAEGAYVAGRLYPKAIRSVVESEQVGAIDPVALLTGEEQEVPVTLAPVNVERDGVEWGFGGDYLYGDTFVLLQMMQTLVLRNDQDLLLSDAETRFALTVRHTFLSERAEAELIGLYGMQGVYGMANPRLTYDVTDAIDVRVGYLAIEGHEESFLGQYRVNDQAYVRIRYLF